MKLFGLITLVMCAFAANSVLNRIGVAVQGMDPLGFAIVRTMAGAVMLWGLIVMRGAAPPSFWRRSQWAGAAALAVYMIGFSWAYQTLDAGFGALLLFGVLQIVTFGWAATQGFVAPLRWIGGGVAFGGLCLLLWPGAGAPVAPTGALAMGVAGVAWGIYTLLGRAAADPLGTTAVNFVLAVPLVATAGAITGMGHMPLPGIMAAIIAGAVTSALGYALWYMVLPDIPATIAGIAQLSVPVIAVAMGVLILSEPVSLRLLLAGALVLGGIVISLLARGSQS